MADFRNRLLLIAGMATVFAGLASAQALTCAPGQAPNAPGSGGGAVPVSVKGTLAAGEYGPVSDPGIGISPTQPIELRSEGAKELVSDTVFDCTGTGGTTLQGQVTAYVTGAVPGLAVTSDLPVLQVIDNSVDGGCDGKCATVYYQGIVVPGSAEVIFGTSTNGTGIYTAGVVVFPSYDFILQVSNIRVNVTGLLNPTIPTAVNETVFAGAEGVATLFQSSSETVGYVLKSLNVTIGDAANYVVCESSAQQNSVSFTVTVSELFAGAFKQPTRPTNEQTAGVVYPATIPGGEQGSFIGVGGDESNPFGTRIKFVVANIPAGVTGLVVPNSIQTAQGADTLGATLTLDLVTGGDIGAAGGVGAAGSTTLPIAAGTVTVIYQVDVQDLTQIKSFQFSPDFVFAANAVVGSQPAITVTTSYAPSPATPGGAIVVPTTYLPYFANTGVPMNGTIWSVCETDLLFPFITTQNGFETGIAISNTALDPFGTTGQPGVCNLYFYGTGQSPAATSPVTPTATAMTSIAIGTTQDTVVSPYLGTNYLGYVIARCQFLFAHGFAFFTNAAPGITAAQQAGYTALVFNEPPATHPRSGTPRSEHLDQ